MIIDQILYFIGMDKRSNHDDMGINTDFVPLKFCLYGSLGTGTKKKKSTPNKQTKKPKQMKGYSTIVNSTTVPGGKMLIVACSYESVCVIFHLKPRLHFLEYCPVIEWL